MALNEKPVRLLMQQDMISSMDIKKDQTFTREQVVEWFAEHYPNVKQSTVVCHITRLSTNNPTRLHHSVKADGTDDIFYKIDSFNYRLYNKGYDPVPITDKNQAEKIEQQEVNVAIECTSEFAYEHDLRDYLARNLHIIEPSLRLYSEQGITGVEFPAGGRSIDILAVDKNNDYVVIELKVSKGYDRTVGQLQRYINWIRQFQADHNQSVRGIIIAKSISEDLRLACSNLSYVSLYEYDLSVSVRKL